MEVTAEIRSWKEHSIVWGSYFTGTIWNDTKKPGVKRDSSPCSGVT